MSASDPKRWGRLIAAHLASHFCKAVESGAFVRAGYGRIDLWSCGSIPELNLWARLIDVRRKQGRLRGRHRSPHDGSSQVERSSVDDAIGRYHVPLQPHSAESLWPRPGGDVSARPDVGANGYRRGQVLLGLSKVGASGSQADRAVEECSGFQHGVHRHGQFSCDSDGRTFEPDPFS